jgi:TolB-like protein/class 3 adenylate cyclase
VTTATRRLAAIMAVDVVGYSRLMGEDEAGTAHSVREHREAARPIVAGLGGRIVKTMGDGLLLEFPSVVAAVECAIAIQKLMAERNADAPEAKRIVYRIGVSLGDVLVEGDDILGDGVNIAARLEGICEPGQVLISSTAFENVRGKIDANFVDLGEKSLKNIARPVRAYALQVDAPALTSPATPARPLEPKKRSIVPPLVAGIAALLVAAGGTWFFLSGSRLAPIAVTAPAPAEPAHLSLVVLPFANLSGDASQDYFADEITENLTTDLARIRDSFVIARDTAFTFKGKSVDAKEIGKELGVRYVLEGSVQRDQNRVRVNAQLIDAQSGAHLWADRFDKPLADLFGMQDEIVAALASQLGAELITDEARRAERAANPDSMDLYFQGMAWVNKGRTAEHNERARGFFERALALDSDNLDASLGLVYLDVQAVAGYRIDDRTARLSAVEAKLTKALSLSPNNAWAHYLMCRVLVQSDRQAQGIAECERTLILNPNLAAAHAIIGFAKLANGHAEETESHELEALRVSPRDTEANAWVGYLAEAKQFLGDDEDAVTWNQRSLEINRNRPVTYFYLASALALLGRLDEARSQVQAGLALDPKFTIRRYRAGGQSDNPVFLKQRERAIEGMRKAGIPEE